MDSSDLSDSGSKKNLHPPRPGIHHASSRLRELSPARSQTDPPAPQSNQQRLQLHRRLGSNTLRNKTFNVVAGLNSGENHRHSRRQHARDAVQSAIELKPPISFEHLLRRDKKGADSARRGDAAALSQSQNQADGEESARQQRDEEEQKQVTLVQLEAARRQNAERESELCESLQKVEQMALGSTRRLDDTYYAILEKVSVLRSTLAGLQHLADETKRMKNSFLSGASSLEDDVQQRLESFGNFDTQEGAVNDLVAQLSHAKDKARKLNQRLTDAWTRVESYEERENAKQSARRKRWRLSSLISLAICVLTIALLYSKHRFIITRNLQGTVRQIDDFGTGLLHPVAALLRPAIPRDEDPYLRKLFDEL